MPSRRRFLAVAAGLAAGLGAGRAQSQVYPTHHVTVVVPVGAGGAPDLFARVLSDQLAKRLGQPVVIENRPGFGGNLALQAVARAEPDGHTLLLIFTPHSVSSTLYPSQGANLERDIAPVIGLMGDNFILDAGPSTPASTLPELIAYAKANPGTLNMASTGTGNMSHLSGALLMMMAGIELTHVPYRSAPAALSDLMAGTVHLMLDAVPSSRPHVESGKLRALAVTGRTRHPLLPDVPTVAETVPGYEVTGWMGIGAPRATPAAVVERLTREIEAVMALPEVTARLAEIGSSKTMMSPTELAAVIAADTRKWAEVVRFAGIKPH